MKKTVVILMILSFSILLFAGCRHIPGVRTPSIGSGWGAMTGGLAGLKTTRVQKTVVSPVRGVRSGAWVGRHISDSLDVVDQLKMAEVSQKAIVTGKPQSWSNSKRKVTGRVEVVREITETVEVDIPVMKGRIEKIPPLDIIGEPYRVTAPSEVRSGPGFDYEIVDSLPESAEVDVIGKVKDKPWLVVGKNQTAIGYAPSEQLQEIPIEERSTTDGESEAQDEVTEQTVSATRTCRTVKQIITLEDGTEKEEEISACQGPNGWEMADSNVS